MSDQENLEELIKEIAAKHGIAVSRDDPILILQTINFRLMQDTQAAQQTMLDQFREEMEGISHRWSDDAKGKAEKILNASLSASREAMAQQLREGASESAAAVRKEVDGAITRVVGAAAATRGAVTWNLVAAGLSTLAAFVALWATMRG